MMVEVPSERDLQLIATYWPEWYSPRHVNFWPGWFGGNGDFTFEMLRDLRAATMLEF